MTFTLTRRLVSRLGLVAGLALAGTALAQAQTTLRIFTGGQQRPDVMRQIVDGYMKANPNVKVEVEVGGATVLICPSTKPEAPIFWK